jgi:hypothetical protein
VPTFHRFDNEPYDETTFGVISDREVDYQDGSGDSRGNPYASIRFSKPKELPNFLASPQAYSKLNGDPNNDQLFQHRPGKIDGLFADPSMKAYVPTLAGLAVNETKDSGRLQVSDDLSAHSSPLAKKAVGSGVLDASPYNPTSKITNDLKHEPYLVRKGASNAMTKPLDDETVAAGKATGRAMLGARRAPSPSREPRLSARQFEQQRLDI